MYASSKIHLKCLSEEEISTLKKLKDMFSELYNLCIETLSNEYQRNNCILTQYELYLRVIHSAEAEQIGKNYFYALNIAIQNFKSSIYNHCNIPDYKSKHHGITLKANLQNNMLSLPATKTTNEILIKVPEPYISKKICIIHIKEIRQNYWELVITYNKETTSITPKKVNCVGVDVGVSNLLAVACSNGNTILYDGKYCKFLYYKRRYKDKADTIKIKNQMNDYINKVVSHFIQFCLDNDVFEVIIGDVFKHGNQTNSDVYKYYKYIPYNDLYRKIEYKCQEYGIKYYCINECYTSKASFIDNDIIPHSLRGKKSYFSGKRVKRGLYRSKNGILINADINGALNILNKYEHSYLEPLQKDPTLINQPKRINVLM